MASLENIKFAISKFPQADYQTMLTPGASPATHLQALVNRDSKFDYKPSFKQNQDQATGTETPVDPFLGKHETSGQTNHQLDIDMIVRYAYAHFGGLDSVETVASTVYTHTLTKQNRLTSNQKPAYEWVQYLPGTEFDGRFPSMVSREFKMAVGAAKDDRLLLSQQWVGSGLKKSPNALIWQPTASYNVAAASARKYLTGLHTQLNIGVYDGSGAGIAPVSYTDCSLQSFDVTATDDLDDTGALCLGLPRYFWSQTGMMVTWSSGGAVNLNDVVTVSGTSDMWVVVACASGYSGILHTSAPSDKTGQTFTSGTVTLKYVGLVEDKGTISGQHLVRKQNIQATFVIQGRRGSRFERQMQLQEPLDIVVGGKGAKITGSHYYSALYHFYLSNWEAADMGFQDDLLTYTVKTLIRLDQITGNDFNFVVKNSTIGTDYIA